MPKWLPAFNKRVTNPIQGLWAPYLPPYIVVLHVGRKTGRRFRTPVLAFKKDGRLFINLVYGSEAQWVKNVLAAGRVQVIRRRRTLDLSDPQIVTRETPGVVLPLGARALKRTTGVLVLTIT